VKIAWFEGDVRVPAHDRSWLAMDEVVLLADTDESPQLRILLVPDDFDLSAMRGDDWNDRPAEHNAERPYAESLPTAARWLELRLGDHVDWLRSEP
jgi:hypothetical protein